MDASLRDVTRTLGEWLDAGRPAVLATVAAADGSAPRGLGARLAIAGPQEWVGALSGGCTEAAVIAEAERLLAEGDPDQAVLVSYVKETMADVGPICGSTLGVLVEVVDDVLVGTLERLVDTASGGTAADLGVTYAWADGATAPKTLLTAGATVPLLREAVSLEEHADDPGARAMSLTSDATGVVLRQLVPASPHLVLGGAGDISKELVLLAERLAWRTTVIDARATILEQLTRACTPNRVVGGWADDAWDELGVDLRTACLALAHESHHDEPFLARALASDAAYVGAVGSRKVQQERRTALAERGLDADAIARLRGPAGLDLGGTSAADVALAIAAEIVATFNDRDGSPLSSSDGPIRA
ncbi:MAG: xanthine dehydrogenase accessory factor CoxI [Thermoleophilia bacterium]|nr:xanthine dehydrogenase accessory factor CoxI [Thermoleophilia bacterium]